MTFEYPILCFLHLKINSSVSTWLQRPNAPYSLQIFYSPTYLQLQHKPIHGWRAKNLVPFGYQLSSPPPPPVCPPVFWCWEWRWSISCAFLSMAAVNVAGPSANNSGQERALCTNWAGAKHLAITTSLTGWLWKSSIQQARKLLEVPERASRKEMQCTSYHYYLCKTLLLRLKLMGMRAWKENAFLLDNRWQL